MKFIEPQHTICWTAYHIFDKLFQAKYETGKLTMNEYCSLINTAMARRTEHIAKNRKWYQFRLRWKDMVFLRKCIRLKSTLEPRATVKSRRLKDINFSIQVSPPPIPTKSHIKNYIPGEIYMGPAPKTVKPVTQSPEMQIQQFRRLTQPLKKKQGHMANGLFTAKTELILPMSGLNTD